MSLVPMLLLFTFQMGLITYMALLLLSPKILSLPCDPQDPTFLSWAHSYSAFHNWSNCWVCNCSPSSSVGGFPMWISPLQGKDFLQLCEYLHQQQSYAMPLLDLMTFNDPKMDWCNTLYINYRHNVTFNFKLQMIVHAPMFFLPPPPTIIWGPWIRDPQYEGKENILPQQFRFCAPGQQEVATE